MAISFQAPARRARGRLKEMARCRREQGDGSPRHGLEAQRKLRANGSAWPECESGGAD